MYTIKYEGNEFNLESSDSVLDWLASNLADWDKVEILYTKIEADKISTTSCKASLFTGLS